MNADQSPLVAFWSKFVKTYCVLAASKYTIQKPRGKLSQIGSQHPSFSSPLYIFKALGQLQGFASPASPSYAAASKLLYVSPNIILARSYEVYKMISRPIYEISLYIAGGTNWIKLRILTPNCPAPSSSMIVNSERRISFVSANEI